MGIIIRISRLWAATLHALNSQSRRLRENECNFCPIPGASSSICIDEVTRLNCRTRRASAIRRDRPPKKIAFRCSYDALSFAAMSLRQCLSHPHTQFVIIHDRRSAGNAAATGGPHGMRECHRRDDTQVASVNCGVGNVINLGFF